MSATGGSTHQPAPLSVRPDLQEMRDYHSPQVEVEVRLNTNESPLPPPDEWVAELQSEIRRIPFNRYPDRSATDLRRAVAELHGVDVERVFCANGSNEVLQSLLLAYGGPERTACVFEPTYTLHRHISEVTGTRVASGWRKDDFTLDLDVVDRTISASAPAIVFLCSPNNPTGISESQQNVGHVLEVAPGLVVVDEAYGQFAPSSALEIASSGGGEPRVDRAERLVVVRTFSKTWSMAACRLGYMIASPEVVRACELVVLPYHLDAVTQAAGRLALRHVGEMHERVALLVAERVRVADALRDVEVDAWPSDANFILFRPRERSARDLWQDLLSASVLVRDCSTWRGLDQCLRVTIGTPYENDRFLEALRKSLAR